MDAIFEQFFGCSKDIIGKVVIISCFDRLNDFRRLYKDKDIVEFHGYYKGITISIDGNKVSIIVSGSGDSRVGDVVLALRESSCTTIIYTGAAGGLGKDISIGDLFIPPGAAIGEGFSRYFIKDIKDGFFDNTSYSAPNILSLSNKYFSEQKLLNVNTHFENIFTIESVFAETKDFLDSILEHGSTAIDMETSAFYTAAQVINKNALAIHFISDLPMKKKDFNILKKACIQIIYYHASFTYGFYI